MDRYLRVLLLENVHFLEVLNRAIIAQEFVLIAALPNLRKRWQNYGGASLLLVDVDPLQDPDEAIALIVSLVLVRSESFSFARHFLDHALEIRIV
jgi:hypothetical protein